MLFYTITLILLGLIFGYYNEKRHFTRLLQTETALKDILVTNLKTPLIEDEEDEEHVETVLVSGSVVIANDAFKKFISWFSLFFGGRIGVYETLLERARREAIVRMKTQAQSLGAQQIINLKIETSTMKGGAPESIGSIEMLAYGTAIQLNTP